MFLNGRSDRETVRKMSEGGSISSKMRSPASAYALKQLLGLKDSALGDQVHFSIRPVSSANYAPCGVLYR